MNWIQLAVMVIQLIVRVWDAIREKNIETKKRKTEALQSGLRGIVDRDAGRITSAFDDINKL